MNRLNLDARTEIVSALTEGNGIRSISRMTGRSQNTVLKLLVEMGAACVRFHDANVRDVRSTRIECDEAWSYVGCKERNVENSKREANVGDVWTWVALDPDSKLAVSWLVGDRDYEAALAFMQDVAARLANRV